MTSPAAPRLTRRASGGWIAVCALLLTGLATLARGAVDTRAVDAIFAQWDKPTSPGVALAIIQDGKIVYEKGYGMANLEAKTPITPETVFYVGSVSKQFTAAAIALLHQRKQVSLDDDVRKYVPELPEYGAPITLRHCILHTSGLRDYLGLRDLAGENVNATFSDADVLALILRQKSLNFPTGSEYLYSNSGYFLLSMVVKRVTGKSLREFAAAEFFGPLGMATAQYRDNHKQPIARRADGYAVATGGGYRVNNPNFDVVGAGGVFMTVRDFLAWDQNFYTPKVGGADFVSLLQTPGSLNNGSKIAYAFGLVTGRYRGLEIVEHSGAYGGFRAHVIRFPEKRFSVVCFSNLGTMTPGELVRSVANVCLAPALATAEPSGTGKGKTAAKGGKAGKSASTAETAALSPAEATLLAGSYRSSELETDYRIVARASGALVLERKGRPNADLVSSGPDTLAAGALRLRFRRDAKGTPVSFTLEAGRVRDIVFTRQ